MQEFVLLFFITAIISFLGSIQLGGVNVAVIQHTLNRSLNAGILAAVGGSLPEFIYAYFAISGSRYLADYQPIIILLNWLIIPIFLGIGLYNLLNSEKKNLFNQSKKNIQNPFFQGLILGILNPQLLPFWLLILVYLRSYFNIENFSSQIAFIVGTGIGAFGVLCSFAYFSYRYNQKIKKIFLIIPFKKLIGLLFIFLSISYSYKFLF